MSLRLPASTFRVGAGRIHSFGFHKILSNSGTVEDALVGYSASINLRDSSLLVELTEKPRHDRHHRGMEHAGIIIKIRCLMEGRHHGAGRGGKEKISTIDLPMTTIFAFLALS
jgi:hypothetical protein